MLPDNVELLSGPGCPVCVTPNRTLDLSIALARQPDVVLTTFGDMLRVPGSSSTLSAERSRGADVRVVYSPLEAVGIARECPDKQIVFLAVGFETTAPVVAGTIRRAIPENFSVLVAHKRIPPALIALCRRQDFAVDGFLCPGHVSTVIGSDAYLPVVREFGVPCVVAGFEPVDVLLAVLMLLRQSRRGTPEIEVEYRTAVRPQGNPTALGIMNEVFEPADSQWRGLGSLADSGLKLRGDYRRLDARERFDVQIEPTREAEGCLCGQVLVGAVRPPTCSRFGEDCTPGHPLGPCMVSSEGSCAAWYRYSRVKP
jgi:hydrogenase expression/formation protein HypD